MLLEFTRREEARMPRAVTQSLKRRLSPLAQASEQLRLLDSAPTTTSFVDALHELGLANLSAGEIEILQVNVGKMCNMACRHCHVDAGPDRREIMDRETIELCLAAVRDAHIHTLDLTGGAPEMNPDFRYFVSAARNLGAHVIDRCNLTILLAAGYQDLPEFLAAHEVEIVASLPCYLEENTDQQRGDGAYRESITALQKLNSLGYGQAAASDGLKLTLVFNPIGPSLPPDQTMLEQQYREFLRREHGIEFNRLFTITNLPISRFLDYLIESNQYEDYLQTLIDAFNPAAVAGVMCRKMISVGWDGSLFDCDFNQMLEITTAPNQPQHIRDFNAQRLGHRPIVVGQHCFGCTAAAGSGCLGAIDK
jgi:radical SAM/Cys-rich protein